MNRRRKAFGATQLETFVLGLGSRATRHDAPWSRRRTVHADLRLVGVCPCGNSSLETDKYFVRIVWPKGWLCFVGWIGGHTLWYPGTKAGCYCALVGTRPQEECMLRNTLLQNTPPLLLIVYYRYMPIRRVLCSGCLIILSIGKRCKRA